MYQSDFSHDSREKKVRKRRWFTHSAAVGMFRSLAGVPLFPNPSQYVQVLKQRNNLYGTIS